MEQLYFSQKPDEKVFFLGALVGRSAARKFRRILPARRPRTAVPKPNNPVKISTGDINTGNNQQEN